MKSAGGLVLVLVVALLVASAVVAGRRGLANAVANEAGDQRTALQERILQSGSLAGAGERNRVYAGFDAAHVLDPHNPELLEQLGTLMAMPVVLDGADGEAAMDVAMSGRRAMDFFAAAVVARPVSGYAWANLALSKYQVGEVDTVLYRSLENAARLGPWEPDVQLAVTDLGWALWDEMPKALRKTVDELAANALQRNADRLFRIAERRGRLAELCGLPVLTAKAGDNGIESKAAKLADSRCQRSSAS
jgi:hypothetical protein